MEIRQMLPIVALTLCVVVPLLKFLLLRHSIREVAEELDEKLKMDTNTLISISTGDQAVQTLAAQINEQLAALRRERLRLQNGDAELKAAVTNMSHNLRTPLTAICRYLDLLEREPHSDNSNRYLAVMRERTDAMCALTQELFQYSVITSIADNLILQPVCLNDLLEQCLAGFYGALTGRGITPEIQMPEQAVIRKLDAAATRRVLENILSNAVKYSDGDLCVSLTVQGKVTFTNHAANLSSVQVERLFDRFYTVETARHASGLGLSIAKLLTEQMGGSIMANYYDGMLSISVSFP
jgi:signal transduction histidine kinase